MGGEIVVTSEVGKGSTFAALVTLPVEQGAGAAPDAAAMRFAIALTSPLLRDSVGVALKDVGARVRFVETPAAAEPGEIVLCLSEQLAKHGGAKGATHVCLTDVGDSYADGLIRDGVAADLLPLPLGRTSLWEFVARAMRGEFRGAAALAGAQMAGPGETFGHLSILAVDDNAVNREVLREALFSLGAEGDFVTNGVEAVEAAGRKAYDVIFMDGSMPEMDGFTATRLIRESEAKVGGARSYIVALTAQVRGADADAWAQAGADRHLTKPFSSDRLMEAMKAAGPKSVQPAAPPAMIQAEPAPPAPPETPMIDEEAVATMVAVGQRNGRDVVGKVWKLFLAQGPDAAFKLDMLAGGSDPAAVAKQAHSLKSMALSAGASRVAETCEEVERLGKAGQMTDACALLGELRERLDAVCGEMRRRLDERAKATG